MASDIVASLSETKGRLVRKVSDISLRRFAIMQSIFNMHKRKIDENADDKNTKKGVCPLPSRQ
jgi:hypothetical protein